MSTLDKNSIIIRQYLHGVIGKLITELALKWRQKLDAVGAMIQNFEDAFNNNELSLDYIQEKTAMSLGVLNKISSYVDDFKILLYPNKQTNKFDVKETLQKCAELMKMILQEEDIEVETSCDVTGFLEGQANEFALVILSLMLNAKESIEAMKPDSAYIKVICKNIKEKTIVAVQDNGKGIAYAIQDELFEPFFTTKDEMKHSGMGLYVSKMIITESFNGKFHFRNTKEGAEFKIEV
jgi:C4-dicarboxylate-specific signal transduction histidine kinase